MLFWLWINSNVNFNAELTDICLTFNLWLKFNHSNWWSLYVGSIRGLWVSCISLILNLLLTIMYPINSCRLYPHNSKNHYLTEIPISLKVFTQIFSIPRTIYRVSNVCKQSYSNKLKLFKRINSSSLVKLQK